LRDVRTDASVATATAAATRATTSCISIWVCFAQSFRTSRRASNLMTEESATSKARIGGAPREDHRIENSALEQEDSPKLRGG
jgi:hypothetical protein